MTLLIPVEGQMIRSRVLFDAIDRMQNSLFPNIVDLHWDPGAASHQNHYYLVVNGPSDAVTDDDVQRFFRTGIDAKDDYFVLVNISSDTRLEAILTPLIAGPALWSRIKKEAPVVLMSRGRIPSLTSVRDITVYPIKNYKEDAATILGSISDPSERSKIIELLKQFNKIVQLKPALFGVGLNFNAVIDGMIERLEKNREKRPPPAR